jgi:autotransporter-associated beta strand protein
MTTLTLAATSALGALHTGTAHAGGVTLYSWNSPTSANWSTANPSYWNDGTVVPVSDFNTQILFNQSGSYTTGVDIVPGNGLFNLSSLTLASGNATDVVTLGVAAGSTDTLNFGPDSNNDAPRLLVTNGSLNVEVACNYSAGSLITNSGSGNLILGQTVQGSQSFGNNTVITNSGNGMVQLFDGITYGTSYNTGNIATAGLTGSVTFANTGGMNGGTGTFLIGNLAEGVTGTVNIIGPVNFNGSTGGNLFGNYTVLNVEANSSFNFASNGETMGGIEGSGNIIEGTAGITLTLPGNRAFTGVISGSGAFSQSNNGTLIFSGQNTYTGNTTVTADGTLQLTVANAIADSAAVLINAGTLDIQGNPQILNNFSGANQTGSLPLGGATLTLNTSSNTINTWFSPLTGTGNVIVNGTGVQALLGLNSFVGNTSVLAGTLQETYEGILGSAGAINVAAGASLDAITNNNVTYAFTQLTDNGAFIKDGTGILTINNHVTNLNGTSLTVNNGGLVLDHTRDNTSGLAGGTNLTLGSASLSLIGNPGAASSETFAGTNLSGGAQITAVSNGQTATINLGAITRVPATGATVNFVFTNAGSGITTTTPNNATGIIGGHAVVNGTDWATATGSNTFAIAALPAASYTANSLAANAHADVTSTFTAALNASTGDIRFNTPAALTLTVNGQNNISNGGILVTPNVGANLTLLNNASNSKLAVPAGQDLVINQYNTAGQFNVSAPIANTAGTPLTVTGVNLTAANYSQGITLTPAQIAGISLGELVTATAVPAANNWEVTAINPITDVVTLAYAKNISGGATNATLTFTPGTNVVKSGPGTLALTASNAFKGMLYLNQGTLIAGVQANYGSTSSGSASLYFNGGTLDATANFGPGSGNGDWYVGPAGGTIYAGTNIVITKYGNTLWGSGNLTLTGPGTFDVGTTVSSFSGQIFDNAGVIRLTSNQLKNSTGITIGNGAQYQLDDTASGPFNLAPGAVLTLNGNGPGNTGAWYHLPDLSEAGVPNYAFNSAIYLASTSRFNETSGINSATGTVVTVTDNFPLPITGPGNLIKDGVGAMVLTSAYNAWGGANGSTIVSNGTIRIGVNNGLPTSTTLQFGETGSTNSGVFDLGGFNQSVAGLTTAGSGTAHQIINSGSSQSVLTVNYSGSTNQIFSSQIGGGTVASPNQSNIAFVKGGSGTLSLTGTTTYTGSATVAAGTLRVTGNAVDRGYAVNDGATLIVTNTDSTPLPASSLSLGTSGVTNLDFEWNGATPTSGAIAVDNGGSVTANGTVDIAVSSVTPLSVGDYPLITYGAGTLQGSGFNAAGATLTLPSRVFGHLASNTSNGSSTGSINSIDLVVTGVDFLKWSGATNSNWDINTTANFALNSSGAAVTYIDQPSPDTVVFDDTATGSHTVNLTTVLSPASVTVNTASSYTFTGSGSINGSTGLTVTGSGTVNIQSSNTYTGATNIAAGTVVVGNGGTTGSLGTGSILDSGALIYNRSDSPTVASTITGPGSLSVEGGGTVTFTSALNIGNGSIASGSTMVVNAGVINGPVSGAGNFVKAGPGIMSVAGDITTTNGVNISGGTLQIGNGGTSGTLSGNTTVAVAAALGFDLSNSYTYSGNISGGGGVTVNQGTIKLAGNLSYSGTTTINANTSLELANPSEFDVNGLITGTGTLIDSGAGLTKVLTKSTGFTGNIIVNGPGTLMLADEGARSALDAGLITINNGGRFIFGEGGILSENPDLPDTTFITIQPGGTFELRVGEQYGATQLQGGELLINGFGAGQGITSAAVYSPYNFLGFDLQSGAIVVENTGTGSGAFTSNLSGGGINKTTPGTVTVTGKLTYDTTTPINIEEGVMVFQAANTPTNGTVPLTIGGGPTTATLEFNDNTAVGTIGRQVVLNSGAFINIPGINNGPGGTLNITATVSGGGDLNLTGAGTLMLSASNNYGGITNIAGGTLVLGNNGTLASPLIEVNTGTTFQLAGATNASSPINVRTLNALNISAGGLVVASASSNASNRQVLVPSSVSLAGTTGNWTSKIDLANNDMIIHGSTLGIVTNQIAQGYYHGTWQGSGGITSSAAASDPLHLTALGVMVNDNGSGSAVTNSFDTASTVDGDVLVKFTYYGDANLDGTVSSADYTLIDAGYLSHGTLTGWQNGDFNYDNTINGSDYTLIDNAFNMQGASLAAEVASPTAQIAGTASAVPEPASLGLLAVVGLGLLGRRRRV